jgi:hypothetical protein
MSQTHPITELYIAAEALENLLIAYLELSQNNCYSDAADAAIDRLRGAISELEQQEAAQ